MDAQLFDHLTRILAHAGPRRSLLAVLAALPLLAGLLGSEEAAAKGRRRRRKKRHKQGKGRHRRKRKKTCQPKSKAKTCAGKCGLVKNNCRKRVDCGPCACDPPCAACFICNAVAGVCEPDPTQQGEPCGAPGQVCQADGVCACDASSCPACATCQSDGACSAPCDGGGCCDGATCQPGDTNAACGTAGEPCAVCSGPDTCQHGACVCTPITTCPAPLDCGALADGCGGTISCGTCHNPTPVCVNNVCTACSQAHPCPTGQYCDGGACHPCDVCPSGCAFSSIQAAIADPTGPATIHICAGTYPGNVAINKNLTLRGVGDGDDPAGNTILDAQRSGRVVQIVAGITATLQGLRITGGAENGGGIENFGSLTLQACTITDNTAPFVGSAGGGIWNRTGATLTMTDCVVIDNHADKTLANGGGIANDGDSLALTGCTVSGNTAQRAGGGIFNVSGALTLNNETSVTRNSATIGGGIANFGGAVTLNSGTSVTENHAGQGGGIRNSLGTVTLNSGASVIENHAPDGSGIFNIGGTVTLNAGSLVCDNDAPQCEGFSPPSGFCAACP